MIQDAQRGRSGPPGTFTMVGQGPRNMVITNVQTPDQINRITQKFAGTAFDTMRVP